MFFRLVSGTLLGLFLTAPPVVSATLVPAQQQQQPQQEEPPEGQDPQLGFVSGTIAELPQGRIVVNRALIGKAPELRSFLITPETVVEGTLRVRVRVTVGFKTRDDGESVAVRIIVRAQAQQRRSVPVYP